jgi:hypothetical protein
MLSPTKDHSTIKIFLSGSNAFHFANSFGLFLYCMSHCIREMEITVKEMYSKVVEFFNSKKNLRIVTTVLMIIVIPYLLTTSFYLLGLLPLIVMWLTGLEGVEFYNVSSSKEIQRTDISYFTTGDIVDSVKLLIILAILFFVIVRLRKMEKKLP